MISMLTTSVKYILYININIVTDEKVIYINIPRPLCGYPDTTGSRKGGGHKTR